ncbi:hypothetical protein [Actinomadura litoris]|uniref:hypothetical protein n=1 Tax=Actinomadura litoris TaxID=2678616 RepID=UPI001FA7D3E4|nr:hypothetical protein [Actinomadura litoris]
MTPTTQQPAAWPEGVIGRYTTVGGSTVDLMHTRKGIAAVCCGCPDAEFEGEFDSTYSKGRAVRRATRAAQDWAQEHAASCRAVPRPGSE